MKPVLYISVVAIINFSCNKSDAERNLTAVADTPVAVTVANEKEGAGGPSLDTALYNHLQMYLVHHKPDNKWPVQSDYPLPGAILPFKRIVAYYGNFYSKGMGILGELPEDQMLNQLQKEAKAWAAADPVIPTQPALHYIAVTAQRSGGKDGKYRLRMPYHQMDRALALSEKIDALLFLDVQVGHSTLQQELPYLEPYLKEPNIHLGIDPEYSMKGGEVPCAVIGTFNAADINYASGYLAEIVRKYQLPPKVLVVHRFTREMVTGYKSIVLHPEVQIVINMDGFGFPAKKIDSYKGAIANEPVQFAGFKLFYKNDRQTSPYRLMTPEEILKLRPSPIYIQYQ